MENFQVGDHVTYVPNHANGDINHRDCERGIVSTVEGSGETQKVWVRYGINSTGQLTPLKNLVK